MSSCRELSYLLHVYLLHAWEGGYRLQGTDHIKAGTHYGDSHEAGAKRRVSSAYYVRAKYVMLCLLVHIFVGRG